jgi:SSS family solute:Na+ symporter
LSLALLKRIGMGFVCLRARQLVVRVAPRLREQTERYDTNLTIQFLARFPQSRAMAFAVVAAVIIVVLFFCCLHRVRVQSPVAKLF